MPRARFEVKVGGAPQGGTVNKSTGEEADDLRELSGDDVTFLLAAKPGGAVAAAVQGRLWG